MDTLRGLIEWAPLGLPAWLFVVTVVVFFHELGHFAIGRACGVQIQTFSIGFGREIVGWYDKHGTRWKIGWLPIGGYVRFLGDADAISQPDREEVEQLPPEMRARTLQAKPLWQRAAIVAAGPVANFILAFVVFLGLFGFWGARALGPYVGSVNKGSAAEAAGIHPGDRIVSLNGSPIRFFADLHDTLEKNRGKELPVVVERNAHQVALKVTPRQFEAKDIYGGTMKIVGLGIAPPDEGSQYLVKVPIPWSEAPKAAYYQTLGIVDVSLTYVWRMVSGRADTKQMSGPVGMAQVAKKAASQGPYELVFLLAFISVSLGLINLFPIPVLDGGHLLYYACEAVLGRPLGERAQDVGFRFGLALVLGLMLFVTWNDLVR